MSANDTQIGGTHYRSNGLQHWDLISMNGVGYLEGCATKYVSRWRKKNGLVDLYKAQHYLDKMHELAVRANRRPTWSVDQETVEQFILDAAIPLEDARIILYTLCWQDPGDIKDARRFLAGLIAQNTPGTPEDGGHHS